MATEPDDANAEFRQQVGAATLLAIIGGQVFNHEDVLHVLPVVSNVGHEIVALNVTTTLGDFNVTVEPGLLLLGRMGEPVLFQQRKHNHRLGPCTDDCSAYDESAD